MTLADKVVESKEQSVEYNLDELTKVKSLESLIIERIDHIGYCVKSQIPMSININEKMEANHEVADSIRIQTIIDKLRKNNVLSKLSAELLFSYN